MNYDPEQLREIADSNPGMSATMARGYASALERIKALEECVLELIDAQVIFEDALQYGGVLHSSPVRFGRQIRFHRSPSARADRSQPTCDSRPRP